MNPEQRTWRYREYFVLIVSTLMNFFLLSESVRIFLKKPGADTPGTFPLLLSAVMLLLNICLFAETRHRIPRNTEKFPSLPAALSACVREELPLNVVVTLFATAAYIALMAAAGFAVSTFLFLVGLTVYLDRKKWKVALISSAVITGVIYVIFGMIFRVRL